MPDSSAKPFSGIFVSYRRDDSSGHAGRLFDRLVDHFGKDRIFMDIDTIEPGEDFVTVIEEAVSSCEILIAIIGRQWLSNPGRNTGRLDNPLDFVRLEIAAALERNIRVIPVLVQRATMPKPQELPDDLAKFSRRNALELTDLRWQSDVDQLIRVMEKVLAKREEELRVAEAARQAEAERLRREEAEKRRLEEAEERREAERLEHEAKESERRVAANRQRQEEGERLQREAEAKSARRLADDAKRVQAEKQAVRVAEEKRQQKAAKQQKRQEEQLAHEKLRASKKKEGGDRSWFSLILGRPGWLNRSGADVAQSQTASDVTLTSQINPQLDPDESVRIGASEQETKKPAKRAPNRLKKIVFGILVLVIACIAVISSLNPRTPTYPSTGSGFSSAPNVAPSASDYPHTVRNASGNLEPASGYTWVNTNDPKDFSVKLMPGLIQGENGNVHPASGYEWVDPNDAKNLRVQLKPGLVIGENGTPKPATGYRWTNNDPKDMSVEPIP